MLVLVGTCRSINALPRAGGLYDQPWNFVVFLQLVLVAEQEKAEHDRRVSEQKMKANAGRR